MNRVKGDRGSEIIAGQRAISADTDLRLCRVLGLSPGYWLRAQATHDTEVASGLDATLKRRSRLLRFDEPEDGGSIPKSVSPVRLQQELMQ